jgi:hypothetical protein
MSKRVRCIIAAVAAVIVIALSACIAVRAYNSSVQESLYVYVEILNKGSFHDGSLYVDTVIDGIDYCINVNELQYEGLNVGDKVYVITDINGRGNTVNVRLTGAGDME